MYGRSRTAAVCRTCEGTEGPFREDQCHICIVAIRRHGLRTCYACLQPTARNFARGALMVKRIVLCRNCSTSHKHLSDCSLIVGCRACSSLKQPVSKGLCWTCASARDTTGVRYCGQCDGPTYRNFSQVAVTCIDCFKRQLAQAKICHSQQKAIYRTHQETGLGWDLTKNLYQLFETGEWPEEKRLPASDMLLPFLKNLTAQVAAIESRKTISYAHRSWIILYDLSRSGDERAYEKLWEISFKKIVYPMTCRYSAERWGTKADLLSEAKIGFFEALRAWNPKRASLPHFIWLCVKRQFAQLFKQLSRKKHRVALHTISLDEPLYEGERTRLTHRILDSEANNFELSIDNQDLLNRLIPHLGKMEQKIVHTLMNDPYITYESIAKTLAIKTKSVDNGLQRIREKANKICFQE